ncbi:hypothetical protein CF392_06885 [Tamilnaduibacter salinus]|uniref:Uncharacterized protein n=1 Tax=Tamilnaduibacter salinus TaxID=1484056 RepID=A0A2A2I5C8_9GAMM|nr:hypothetical protein [Tamilnaduibacter salinus]PAV26233.1 hypothetical protein CF392_06885 [Tamilnaduibacter salinus]
MAVHEEQFENHGVHDVLSQLESAIKKPLPDDAGNDARDNLDRLRQGVAFIRDRLEGASPTLTPVGRLDQIQKSVQSSLNEINQFQSNNNAGHLTNASNQIDGALNTASTLISLEQPNPQIKAKDVVSFKALAENVIEELQSKASSASEELSQLSENIDGLNEQAEKQKHDLNALRNSAEAKFQEFENQFQAEQSDRKNRFEENIEDVQSKLEKQLAQNEDAAEKTLEYLGEKQHEAERIVNLIGNVGLTGNFKGAASQEKQSADRLRTIALVCFLVMVAVVIGTLFISISDGFDPWLALFRLGAGLTLIIPAAYAARESSRHRALEIKNRRAELELASIDAYLESLPEERRNEIKAQLTDKFFGQVSEEEKPDPQVKPDSLVSLLKEAIGALGKK